ncbi:hypothetical protein [Pseudoalteromonas sp.]|uniref:hypothetical protein n=1 Tax=Pseudoalteromonas sp. TaxID=53249 RepID=UPI003D113E9A
MPEYNNEDLLRLQTPETGRKLKENASPLNVADIEYIKSVADPSAVALRQQAYFVQDLRENLAQGDVYYYRLKAPVDKDVIIFNRNITTGQGAVRFETLVQPSSFVAGTLIPPVNLWTGGQAASSEFEAGVAPTGGTLIPADYLFSVGNKQGTASASQIPTILPRGLEIFAKLTNEGTGTNAGIRFSLAFAEVDLSDILVI